VSEGLDDTLSRNPHLRLFFASGIYDLATPYFATEYTLRHLKTLQRNPQAAIEHRYFGGHMMYLEPTGLEALSRDFRAFVLKGQLR
ncbi:MAG: peptidase S10, partial [Chlamydiia bacterium]|nr:peptidase S10 [Chlamydiia bacterium]